MGNGGAQLRDPVRGPPAAGVLTGTPCSFLKPSGGLATKVKVHFQRFQPLLRVADSKSSSWMAVGQFVTY